MSEIKREDYEEPRCPMDNSMWVEKPVTRIPEQRVIEKEDEYLARGDYEGAEKHLLFWMGEAELGNDDRGRLLISSELMGLCRKTGKAKEAMEYAEKAMELARLLNIEDTRAGGTALLNAATVYKAFGEPERSLEIFEKAKSVLEDVLGDEDPLLAGLYNNMGLTLIDLGRYKEAKLLFNSALLILSRNEGVEPDMAITYLNMADCAEIELGSEAAEKITRDCLDRAEELLDSVPPERRNPYYSFVCGNCIRSFEYYGYFTFAKELRLRSGQ